jgi:Tfp pilus assembly protein PilF
MGEVSEETALSKLILAGFYEQNNLIIDAIYAYEKAVEMAPDVPTFQESYEDFLLRNNLK